MLSTAPTTWKGEIDDRRSCTFKPMTEDTNSNPSRSALQNVYINVNDNGCHTHQCSRSGKMRWNLVCISPRFIRYKNLAGAVAAGTQPVTNESSNYLLPSGPYLNEQTSVVRLKTGGTLNIYRSGKPTETNTEYQPETLTNYFLSS